MRSVYFSILIAVFILGILTLNPGYSKPEKTVKISEPAIDSLTLFLTEFEEKLLEGARQKNLPGGAFVITYKDEILVAKGFGTRKIEEPLPINEHTVFRLGSVSKGFASVLTGMLTDDNLISFDDTVEHILPEFQLSDPDQTQRVKIQHLLSHTTGLPRHSYTNLVEDGLSLERIVTRFENVPLIGPEGEHQAYTNAAYAMIELALEKQTDSSFAALLDKYIFQPLKMTNSSSNYSALTENYNVALPHLYNTRLRKRTSVPIRDNYFNAVSAGGINASAHDMGKWLLLLTGNYPELIKGETLDQIFEPISTIPNKRFSRYWPDVNESHYGMGWRTLMNEDQKIIYHGGYVNGYRSEIAFDKDNQIGICILLNSNSGYALEVIPGFFNRFNSIDQLFETTDLDSPRKNADE